MNGKVFVYRGEGAGWRSVKSTCESVERLLSGPLCPFIKPCRVDTLSTSELLDGRWTQHAAVLVMPGGADLPYCKHLNGKGNSIIKEYVHSGGSYLGLCAGAYYGCSRVVFEPGTTLQVVGDRELAFFPGIATGAAFPGFDYLTEAGAVAAQVQFSTPKQLQTLQEQQEKQQQVSNGTGLQQQKDNPWVTTYDYCNGGPYFTSADGSPDIDQLPGVTVLAQYCQVPIAAAGTPLSQQPKVLLQRQQQCQQQVLPQPDQQQRFVKRVAAVRCSVGKGVAVLCGTHPELGPEWLDPCGDSNAVQGPQPHETVASDPAAAAAAAPAPGGNIVQQQQQQQQEAEQQSLQAAAGGVQLLVQEAVGPSAASTASSQVEGQSMPVVCRDVALAAHAQQLRQQLQASQAGRDLLLCSLLYHALAGHSRE